MVEHDHCEGNHPIDKTMNYTARLSVLLFVSPLLYRLSLFLALEVVCLTMEISTSITPVFDICASKGRSVLAGVSPLPLLPSFLSHNIFLETCLSRLRASFLFGCGEGQEQCLVFSVVRPPSILSPPSPPLLLAPFGCLIKITHLDQGRVFQLQLPHYTTNSATPQQIVSPVTLSFGTRLCF